MSPRRTKAGGPKKRPTRYAPPHDTPLDLAEALRAHRKGHVAEAVARYRERLVRNPACLDSHMNLATALVRLGRAREARLAFVRALALAPQDPRVHRDAGIGFASLGALGEARTALATAFDLDPGSLGAPLALARLLAEQGHKRAALDLLAQASSTHPTDASVQLERHRVLFDDRALGPAIEAARRAVDLDPQYALARFFLAGALGREGQRAAMQDALGPPGLVAEGLVDALMFALEERTERPRHFATKRDTLTFALGQTDLPGPLLEFGVRHGISTRLLAADENVTVHAFDSFRGLPQGWQGQDPGAFSTDGELPAVPANVRLHVGTFEDTLPPFAAQLVEPPRLVHIDADLYESARTVLHHLGPHLTTGCVLVFDELIGNASWRQDEYRAFTDAAQAFGWTFRTLALSWITGQGVFALGENA